MKIGLYGYGKMGKEIEKIAISRGHSIALKIDINNANTITSADLKSCDAIIEFSTPHSAIPNMLKCFESGTPVVVGTTGWYDKADEMKKICEEKNACLFYTSNFSIGVNIFFKVNEYLAKLMNNYESYNVSIEEIHHIHKLDAPSGTGLSLANQILGNYSKKTKWVNTETNKENELAIISKREGEVPGTHIIKYQSAIDDIEITHTAHNRQGFALGAVLAAEFVKGKKGVYGMNELMKL
ncbi:MAG TPA: 4-hydroxy-tetrahydrodipicolinate reductase [Bacteroidia bacterium]|nr:4-hydroxy-tetrahydrodipicolinate reductase [Bacteroidia bacterium]